MGAPEVARRLGIGRNKVYELARSGDLPSYRIGRKLRFSVRDVEAFLARAHSCAMASDVLETFDERDVFGLAAASEEAGPVCAGENLLADILAGALGQGGAPVTRLRCSDFSSLVQLYCGKADMAVVSLFDARANRSNIPFVQHLAPGVPVSVVRLAERKMGFVVRKGDEGRCSTWSSLLRRGASIVNRPLGTSERVLLDEKLLLMEERPESVAGYDDVAGSTSDALGAVKSGRCGACIGGAYEARLVEGLGFTPLQMVAVDVVVRRTQATRGLMRLLKHLVSSASFRDVVAALCGFDAARTGAVVYER